MRRAYVYPWPVVGFEHGELISRANALIYPFGLVKSFAGAGDRKEIANRGENPVGLRRERVNEIGIVQAVLQPVGKNLFRILRSDGSQHLVPRADEAAWRGDLDAIIQCG